MADTSPDVSFITLPVSDLARSRAFYEALGFVPSEKSSDFVTYFPLNGQTLALFGAADLCEMSGATMGVFRSVLAHNCAHPEEVPAWLIRVEAAGGTVTRPTTPQSWGQHGWFTDLDGHLWEIAYNARYT